MVRSIIEYASPVCQIISTENLSKLESIQRKGLALCLEVPSTSGREALEIEANVLPLDLRFEEMSIREIAKIQSKAYHESFRQQL